MLYVFESPCRVFAEQNGEEVDVSPESLRDLTKGLFAWGAEDLVGYIDPDRICYDEVTDIFLMFFYGYDTVWLRAECTTTGKLTTEQIDDLSNFLSGQYSDGWGEGYEQEPTLSNGIDYYVDPWYSENWHIELVDEIS